MIVSEARLAANRRNAQRSTGPKTEEGKQRSRANALKHGLCSSVVVAEDAEAVQRRASEWFDVLRPKDRFQAWLVDEVAVISLRIDRCERIERRLRDRKALRAELYWEDDRRLDATRLGGMISGAPEGVVEQLRRTPQGCEWLMERWAMLAHVADLNGSWSPEQAKLAFDLLGTPREFREGVRPGTSLDLEGRVVESADDPAAVARRQIAALRERRDLVEGLDDVDQALAVADLDEADPELRRLRRYEGALHRRLRWCLAQFRMEAPDRPINHRLRPRWDEHPELMPKPVLAPNPEPEPVKDARAVEPPNPPIDLEPEEVPAPGEPLDVPKILSSRRERRLRKAAANRETRRRKLDRLRA